MSCAIPLRLPGVPGCPTIRVVEPATDSEILDGFAAGDGGAFRHVQGWVEGVVRVGRWNFEDPEGVVQEVLLKLLRIVRSGRYRGQSSFKTFAFSVARHTSIDIYRRQRLRTKIHAPEQSEAPSPEPDAGERVEQRERLECLSYIFQRLPDDCRRLWSFVYGEGLSAAEVGRRLGITPGNVRVRTHRCLQKARDIATGFHGGPLLNPGAGP